MKQTVPWLVGALFLVAPALAAAAPRPILIAQDDQKRYEAQQLFNRATDRSAAGDFAGAVEAYSGAIKLYPGYYQAYAGRAQARMKSNDLDGAIADYQQMVKIFPNDIGVYHNLGKIAFARKNYPDTIKYTTEALNRTDASDIRYLRATSYIRLGNFEKALEDYNKTLEARAEGVFFPEDAPTVAARGRLYQRVGNYAKAIEDYTEAIRLDPKLVETYGYRAALKQAQGSNLSTLEDCDRAIAAGGRTALVYYIQGNARSNLAQKAMATEAYNQAATLPFGGEAGPEDFDFKARGDARYNQKLFPEALADYDEAIRFNPGYAEAYLKRGSLKSETSDRSGAIADLQKAQQLFTARGDTLNAGRTQSLLAKLGA